ncbi:MULTISPECIES: hypothetical protein [unclassified Microcoleus]
MSYRISDREEGRVNSSRDFSDRECLCFNFRNEMTIPGRTS